MTPCVIEPNRLDPKSDLEWAGMSLAPKPKSKDTNCARFELHSDHWAEERIQLPTYNPIETPSNNCTEPYLPMHPELKETSHDPGREDKARFGALCEEVVTCNYFSGIVVNLNSFAQSFGPPPFAKPSPESLQLIYDEVMTPVKAATTG
jgi:hypothetical protein